MNFKKNVKVKYYSANILYVYNVIQTETYFPKHMFMFQRKQYRISEVT